MIHTIADPSIIEQVVCFDMFRFETSFSNSFFGTDLALLILKSPESVNIVVGTGANSWDNISLIYTSRELACNPAAREYIMFVSYTFVSPTFKCCFDKACVSTNLDIFILKMFGQLCSNSFVG